MDEEPKGPLFKDIDADDEPETTAIESLCLSCEKNGTTRLLLTRIPFFKEIILMSFECPHCGCTNNEIQSAGRIQEKGCTMKLSVSSPEDLNRQVVKSDAASFTIPELEFESPAFSQKGELNTIEGLLERAIAGLGQDQPVRKIIDPDNAAKIDIIISQLTKCRNSEMKFTLVLDDASGNSFIENPQAPDQDPHMTVVHYTRQPEQDAKLGIQPAAEEEENKDEEDKKEKNAKDEVLSFPTNCPLCNAPAETRMKLVAIPHFKEVIVMATNCDACGERTNEVKSGGGIEAKGTRITLRITDPVDLNRDVLKSETCEVILPSLDFTCTAGTLGGRFTTLEGLLSNMKDHVSK
ncbi:zinc finger protein ZPR1-like [Orbicella faveolata]|uniref:zinc finger protein ZPR1-like n=1 Tax=Orbicella faveolata TaxID=48498 RepID=UPI0009E1C62D|nr:zinc finger protein ZPR1-like [Orbicella faveolata]